jgi:hypothetical protein
MDLVILESQTALITEDHRTRTRTKPFISHHVPVLWSLVKTRVVDPTLTVSDSEGLGVGRFQ